MFDLNETELRHIEHEEDRICRAVRDELAAHGQIGSFLQLGLAPEHLKEWIRIYARQLVSLYAGPCLKVANAASIQSALIGRLLGLVHREWLRGVNAETVAALQAVAEVAIRDEFAKCFHDPGNANSAPSIGVMTHEEPTDGAPARPKRGPKPRTQQFTTILRVLQQVYGEEWKNWRSSDLYDLAEALDAGDVPVPTPWRKRDPKRKTWADGLDLDKETFKKTLAYAIKQALKAAGSNNTPPPTTEL